MSTNSGEKGIKKEGNWSNWGKAYLDETTIVNIVSLSNAVAKGYCVRIDTDVENCLYVTHRRSGRTFRFPCDSRGLYVNEEGPLGDCYVAQVHTVSKGSPQIK